MVGEPIKQCMIVLEIEMLKIAIAATKQADLYDLKELLAKHYNCKVNDETVKDGLHVSMLQIDLTQRDEIEEMFHLIEIVAGVPNLKMKGKQRLLVRARRAASYLLCKRFGLTAVEASRRLYYKSHAGALIHTKEVDKNISGLEVKKPIPIELVVRRTFEAAKREYRVPERKHLRRTKCC